MAASWPAGLPYFVARQAYGVQALGQQPLSSQVQSGKIRMRPQFTLRISRLSYGWILTAPNLSVFHEFVADMLGEGTGEFTIPLWIETAGTYQSRMVQIVGASSGIAEKKVGLERTLVTCQLDVRNL
ncbi:hypothetical protein [Methylobacterium sp. WSM2598]|uniref:hypothetical protein n=1 Tax=Methylobacterium sp. WSM2598 TaxID=398261 RepID=UPI0003690C0E|nr:hypothetical protein [Methylobacterium sp. WSM2598]